MFARILGQFPSKSNTRRTTNGTKLRLEALESREVPAIITVNSGRDVDSVPVGSNEKTLRMAVAEAQNNGDGDNTIVFDTIQYPAFFFPPIDYPPNLPPAPLGAKLVVLTQQTAISMNITQNRTLKIDGFLPNSADIGVVVQRGDTAGNQGMLRFTGTGRLTVQGIQFRDGVLNGITGGAAVSTESLFGKIDRCEFVNCRTASANGGAVANYGMLVLDHAKFYGNHAIVGNNAGGSGGAVYNAGIGGLTAVECTFKGNAATGNGGAISSGGASSYVGLATCTFENNTAEIGGAVYNVLGEILSVSSIFLNNTAISGATGGGGIYTNAKLTITDGRFEGNTADANGGGVLAEGINTVVKVLGSTKFRSNSAGKGGAFSIRPLAGQVITDPEITGATFELNKSTAGEGGAIYASGGSGTLKLTGCVFEDNKVVDLNGQLTGVGGAISLSTWSGVIKTTTFRRNQAAEAGAVLVKLAPTWFTTCTFEDNVASVAAPTIGWVGNANNNLVTIDGQPGQSPTSVHLRAM